MSEEVNDGYHDICPDGDVILVVGADVGESTLMHLRVSSSSLKSASKVFNVILGPQWEEGQDLSARAPKKIELPGDDAEAMRIVCCVINCKNEAIPGKINPTVTDQIAIICDKYGFHISLKYFIPVCFRSNLRPYGKIKLGRYATAAYILKYDKGFHKVCQELIMRSTGSYQALLQDEFISQCLPDGVICEFRLSLRF